MERIFLNCCSLPFKIRLCLNSLLLNCFLLLQWTKCSLNSLVFNPLWNFARLPSTKIAFDKLINDSVLLNTMNTFQLCFNWPLSKIQSSLPFSILQILSPFAYKTLDSPWPFLVADILWFLLFIFFTCWNFSKCCLTCISHNDILSVL